MPADDVLLLLFLAVLYEVPVVLAAMACTWLVHEWSLHGWARLRRTSLASRAFWTRTVWDHPGYLLPSYVLLFIAFLSLWQLPRLYATNANGGSTESSVLSLGWIAAYLGLLFALGAFALRARLRAHMA